MFNVVSILFRSIDKAWSAWLAVVFSPFNNMWYDTRAKGDVDKGGGSHCFWDAAQIS